MQQSVTIEGHVSSGVQLEIMPSSGKPKCKFDLAVPSVNQQFGIAQEVQIHVVGWNDLAENAFNHILKGNDLKVTGRWDTRKYLDKNGQEREWTDFVAFNITRGGVELRENGFAHLRDTLPEGVRDAMADITPWEGVSNESADARTGELEASQESNTTEPSEQASSQG